MDRNFVSVAQAEQTLKSALRQHELLQAKLVKQAVRVHKQRAESLKTLEPSLKAFYNNTTSLPSSFLDAYTGLEEALKEFKEATHTSTVELENIAVEKSLGKGAGMAAAAAGGALAVGGPTAAIALATTFGTASTGVAISSLTGAAATNAALAALGGGALAAGGAGVAGGAALISLLPGIGIAIAATGGLLAWRASAKKKAKYYADVNEALRKIDEANKIAKSTTEALALNERKTQQHTTLAQRGLQQLAPDEKADYGDYNDTLREAFQKLMGYLKALTTLFQQSFY